MAESGLTPLGKEIRSHLERLQWSQNRLADEAGVARSTLSRLMRGYQATTAETVDALARTVGVDPLYFMRLAGLPLPADPRGRDPQVERLAQRIDALDPGLRRVALGAVDALLDGLEGLRVAEQVDVWVDGGG